MKRRVQLWDVGSQASVGATISDELTAAHFLQAQDEWRPLLLRARDHYREAGKPESIPQHCGWNWGKETARSGLLGLVFYGVECRGKLQGLMATNLVSHSCRLPDQLGKPLVYIEHLESAPWNVAAVAVATGEPVVFAGVGTQLVRAAIKLSRKERFRGRVGLHSLPQSEGFYRQLGMAEVGPDPGFDNLVWYEFTPDGARRLLSESGGTV